MDLDAIANGMAAEFAAMTAPTGQPAIIGATAQSIEAINQTPYLVIEGPDGPVGWGASTRSYEATFKGYFCLNQVPAMPSDLQALRLWLGALLSVPMRHQQLAIYNDSVSALSLAVTVKWWRVAVARIAAVTFGGQSFNGVELDLAASIFEPIAPSS